jgi:hypothetical protein
MGRVTDEAHVELVAGGIALNQLLLPEALADFRSAQRRLEGESSSVANCLYVRACLLEWQVLHLEGRRLASREVARRAMPRAMEAGGSAARLVPTVAVKILETYQTANKFTAVTIAPSIYDGYVGVAGSLEDTAWGSPLALHCYFQLIPLGLDSGSDALLREASRGAKRALLHGGGDSGGFSSLRFWESRAAIFRRDVDAADTLLSDSITAHAKSFYHELADQFPLINLLLVRGETDVADELLQDALALAHQAGCRQWARDAEIDRLTLGRLFDIN